MKNIFLTGEKYMGKSTLIQGVLNRLNLSAGGYTTERVIKDNKRIYTVKSLHDNSESYLIANVDAIDYSREVFMDSFDVGIVSILEKSLRDKDIIILDELGFFENDSEKFKRKIYELLDSNKVILGTIKDYDCEFLNNLKKREDILLIEVTKENREEILDELVKIVSNLIANI
ncbi:MAG: nucleoside-triphosphatase [Candidatus Alkaliphilus sp. MAG34]